MTLLHVIERYIVFRQSLGMSVRSPAYQLRAFGRTVGERVDIAKVRAAQVNAFLGRNTPITRTWHDRLCTLRTFYRYAVSRGYVKTTPLPTVIPKRPPSFVPYIYSTEELRRLLNAVDSYNAPRTFLENATVRTILLLLYGTGLRFSEALTLKAADVDADNALLIIRETKFSKTRQVPFCQALGQVLAQYALHRSANQLRPPTQDRFFITRHGTEVRKSAFYKIFRRIRTEAGISRGDGASCQPRLHDLRHTFAVHRLTAWYRHGLDVQKLLPHLSVYLGHVNLASTQVYLSMTPELLNEAGTRFETYACGRACHDRE
jgi:site-specific recombinase XerD